MSPQKYLLHAFSFFLTTLLLASCAGAQPAPNLLKNGGFEAPFEVIPATGSSTAKISGSLADGWQDISPDYSKVDIHYAEEKDNPHSGQSCQKVEINKIEHGAAQFAQSVSLQKGHTYKVTVWLRANGAAVSHLSLRQASAPTKTYVSKIIPLPNKWQRQEIAVLAPETEQVSLIIVTDSPVTYYMDDAMVQDVTNAGDNQPLRKGNLLADGSFETGMGNGWSVAVGQVDVAATEKNKFSDARPHLDTDAYIGKHSLRIDIPDSMRAIVSSPPVTFDFNRPFAISVWMKASRATDVDISLIDTTQTENKWTGRPVTTEWTRVTLEGTSVFSPQTNLTFLCGSGSEPLTLWIDGAMLEDRAEPSPTYLPAYPVELSLSAPRPGSIFFDGQSAQIDVSTAWDSASSPRQDVHLALQLEDVDGTVTKLPSQALSVSKVTIPPDVKHPRGIWKLRAQVENSTGEALSAPTEQVFTRLPHPRVLTPTESENSYFGVHIPLSPQYIQITQDIGAHWVRLHDTSQATKWDVVEPQKGQWNWIDEGVDAARGAGLHILGLIDQPPTWASKTVQSSPNNIADWEEYARRVSLHFKGRINTWEIWNEPYSKSYFVGTPEQYATLLRSASLAVKAATPNAKVVAMLGAMNASAGETWPGAVTATAPISLYDIVSFHNYTFEVYGGPNSKPIKYQKFLEDTLAQHGGERPLWDTEEGSFQLNSWYDLNGQGQQYQMTWIVRDEVTQLGAGASKFFYYLLDEASYRNNEITGVDYDRSLKPVLAARAVLAYLVDGAKCTGRTEPQPGIDQYTFQFTDEKTVKVLWSYDNKTHRVEVPKGAQVLDLMGNKMASLNTVSIGAQPVYLTTG